MDYTPLTAVWEITMGCNMRCNHCGSSCAEPLPDELTTEEALKVCDDMKALGMKWITLSGGEPLTRMDWPLLAGKLYKNGIIPNIITNGWLVTEDMVKKAEENGVETVSISLDGVEKTHDAIRKKGAYARVIQAFRVLNKFNHISGANTTVTKENMDQLDEIKEILLANNVDLWQLQIGLPMGNLAKRKDLIVEPDDIDYVLKYSYDTTMEGKIKVFPADCLGYFTEKETVNRQISIGSTTPVLWQGCNSGKRSFGLLHNGDVLGCTSIREKSFIEGNIRDRSLVEMWNDPDSFTWARSMKKTDLTGDCAECCYGDVCLGGCPNTRLTLNGSIYSENIYCAYHNAMEKTREKLRKYTDIKELSEVAWSYVEKQKWQLASLTIQRALQIEPDNADLLALFGYVSFALGNFSSAREANESILKKDPNNAYALKGMGLSMHKLQENDVSISYLEKAAELSTPDNMDAYYDLSVVYNELGRNLDALRTLERGESKAPGFLNRVAPFYNQLTRSVGAEGAPKSHASRYVLQSPSPRL